MKKFSTFFVTGLLILLPVSVFASFPDVPPTHANYDAIVFVQSKGIVRGYPDGSFRPNQTINRAEFVKILVRAYEPALLVENIDTNSPQSFSDVRPDDWFYQSLYSAFYNKVIAGYSDGTFKPGNTINFVEAAKILAIADHIPQEPLEGTEWHPLAPATGEAWYKPFVDYLAQRNVIPVSIGSFDQKITRAEMAEMVYRLQAGVTSKPAKTYDDVAGSARQTMTVTIYLAQDDDRGISYVPVGVQVPATPTILRASLETLLNLPTENGVYQQGNLLSDLYLSHLAVDSATIVDGVAHVKLTGTVQLAGDLSGPRAVEEITRTVTQFSSVTRADITVNGSPLKCLADESGNCH